MKRTILIIISLMAICHCIKAQIHPAYNINRVYTTDELQKDFYYIRTILERTHPSLYRYTPKDSINYYFAQTAARLNHPMTEPEFWRILQTMVVRIKSGHTEVQPSIGYSSWLYAQEQTRLPFGVIIKDNRLFVFDVHEKGGLYHTGDEIININGEPAAKVLTDLRGIISADGYNVSYKDLRLQGQGFLFNYTLVHPGNASYSNMTFVHDGVKKTVDVQLEFVNKYKKVKQDTVAPQLIVNRDFDFYKTKTMPLTELLLIHNFTYKDYGKLHSELSAQLEKDSIKNLIIDVRNNGGGTNIHCVDLLKYLVAQPYMVIYKKESIVRQDTYLRDLDVYKASQATADLDRLLGDINNVGIISKGTAYKSQSHIFAGKVYLLTNAGSFSAAALFAVTLKLLGNCTVIGSETGGGLAGCDGGEIPIISLPNTKLRFRMPLYFAHSVATAADKGHGLLPDITVDELPGTIGTRYDKAMQKVQELISAETL
jgi:hypothetical protein